MDALIMDMGNAVQGECSRPGYEKMIELRTFEQGDPGVRAAEGTGSAVGNIAHA